MFNEKRIMGLEQRIETLEFLLCKGSHTYVEDPAGRVGRYTKKTCSHCGKQGIFETEGGF